jgi:predicted transcriptional regulator
MPDKEKFDQKKMDAEMAEIIGAVKGDDYLRHARKLSALCCSQAELAAFFGTTQSAIHYQIKKDKAFAEAIQSGNQYGRLSLRRSQFQAALDGNPAMLIWLGKQLLGQSDRSNVAVDFSDCKNNRERAEKILQEVADGKVTVQDGAMLMNMAKTVIDETNLEALERIGKLEKIASGDKKDKDDTDGE